MEEQPGLSDQYRTASPWPLLVAVGFALSEVGVFLGVFPVAVGGVLLLGASVAGILGESGYATRPWRTLAYLGVGFAVLGGALVATQVFGPAATGAGVIERLLDVIADPNGVAGRGLAVAVAGIMLVAAGAASQAAGRSHRA